MLPHERRGPIQSRQKQRLVQPGICINNLKRANTRASYHSQIVAVFDSWGWSVLKQVYSLRQASPLVLSECQFSSPFVGESANLRLAPPAARKLRHSVGPGVKFATAICLAPLTRKELTAMIASIKATFGRDIWWKWDGLYRATGESDLRYHQVALVIEALMLEATGVLDERKLLVISILESWLAVTP